MIITEDKKTSIFSFWSQLSSQRYTERFWWILANCWIICGETPEGFIMNWGFLTEPSHYLCSNNSNKYLFEWNNYLLNVLRHYLCVIVLKHRFKEIIIILTKEWKMETFYNKLSFIDQKNCSKNNLSCHVLYYTMTHVISCHMSCHVLSFVV